MTNINRARKILSKAAHDLKDCLRAALDAGDYDAIGQIAQWAKTIEALDSGTAAPGTDSCATHEADADPGRVMVATLRKRRRQNKKSVGPRFYRGADALIKVGASRKSDSTYEHRAPKAVLEALVAALSSVPSDEALVTMDDLLPLDIDDGDRAPTYQSYLCLRFLADESLVSRHGRRGYTVTDPTSLTTRARAAYNALDSI